MFLDSFLNEPKMGYNMILTVELIFEQIPSVDADWLTLIN
jgi:hypothetical protein